MSYEIIEFLWLLSAFINAEALKDQRGLDLPAWKKELFGVTDDAHEEAIFVKRFEKLGETEKSHKSKSLGFLDDYYNILLLIIHTFILYVPQFISGWVCFRFTKDVEFPLRGANYTVSWSKTTELPGYLGRGGSTGESGRSLWFKWPWGMSEFFECLIFFWMYFTTFDSKVSKKTMKEWNESQIFVHTYIFFWITRICSSHFLWVSQPLFYCCENIPWQSSPGEASVSAVIKVRSETTEVTKAELSEATPAGEIGWRLGIVGAWWVLFETFPLVFFGCPVRNYYELWKLDVTEGMVWDSCKKWVGAFWKRSPWFLIWRWSGFWGQVCNSTVCNTSLYRRLLPMERTRFLSRRCFNISPAAILCFSPRPHKAKPLDCMSHLACLFFQKNNLWSGHNLYPFQPCLVSLRPPASQFSRHSSSQEMRVMGFLEGRKHPRFVCILLIYIYFLYIYIYTHTSIT